jgi:hypothetical protein
MNNLKQYNKAIAAGITAFIISLLVTNGFEVPDDTIKLIEDLVTALLVSGALSGVVWRVPNIKKETESKKNVDSNTI